MTPVILLNALVARILQYVTHVYCFSFYVTALLLIITRYQLLYPDWRGYLISGFSLVWIANIYMSLFFLIRTDLKNYGLDSKIKQSELDKCATLKETINTVIKK